MTNVTNIHACFVGSVDLIIPLVFVMNSQLVKLTRNVVCCTNACVPIQADSIGCGSTCILVIITKIFIKTVPAIYHNVPFTAIELALGPVVLARVGSIIVVATSNTSSSRSALGMSSSPWSSPSSGGTMAVSRGHGVVLIGLLQRQTLLEVEQLGVDITDGEGFLDEKCGDDRGILLIKTNKDVGD